MDDLLFGRWRSTVGPDDLIVCLDRVALCVHAAVSAGLGSSVGA